MSQAQPHGEDGVSCFDCGHHDAYPNCHQKTCHPDEVCQINYNGHDTQIRCRKQHECTRDSTAHSSSLQPLCTQGGSFAYHSCQTCCTSAACVSSALNMPTSNTQSAWEVLKGTCADQLVGNQCQTLYGSKLDCNNRVSLRVCPKTCGLCSLYGEQAGCKDIVVSNGCPTLDLTDGVCSSASSMHICPVTCNKCDALLDDRINRTLMAQHGSVTVPAHAVTTADPLTLACSVLDEQTCDVQHALCPLVHCPVACSKCAATTTAAPTPAPQVTTTVSCVDNLQGTNCADVIDVCTSSLLASYCPKYCGTC